MGTQVLVLHYGYAEDSLTGYDIWATEDDFELEWEALRNLAHFLLQFYLGEQEACERLRPMNECCKQYKDLAFLPGCELPKFCPVCGRRYSRVEFNVEYFASWIKDVYVMESHESPNFWEYEEDWCRTREFSYLLESYPPSSFFEVPWSAERVIASALDPEQLPEASREDFKEQTKHWFKSFEEEVQSAYYEFEEKQGRESDRKTAWEEDEQEPS